MVQCNFFQKYLDPHGHNARYFSYFRKIKALFVNIMKLRFADKRINRIIARTFLIIASTAIIVWFLPHNESQRIRYDIGKPWMYGSFIAKFDFPIYKTDEAVKQEQDSLAESFQPYYRYDGNVEQQQIEKFRQSVASSGLPVSHELESAVINRLHQFYMVGIMATSEYQELAKDSSKIIRVVNGNEAVPVVAGQVFSTMGVYERLMTDERFAEQKSILQRLNVNEFIEANLIYDRDRSQAELNDLLSGISPASGMVLAGQKIIDRGEIVDEYDYRVLSSFEREMQRRSSDTTEITSTIIGQLLFVLILISLFSIYLVLFRKDYFAKPRNILMLYVMVTLFPVLVSLMVTHNVFSVYILPLVMVPIFVRVFLDSRTAFITHVTMVIICAAAVKYQYEFIIVQIVGGIVAIYSLRELSRRAQVFRTAFLVALSSCAVYFALQLMQDSEFNGLDHSMYTYLVINGVFLLMSYPLMYLIEKTFGFISDVTLFELSDTNKGILRELSEVAPGTFQHSITVANLAAEIANKIGANSLLVRTGALYHDIGKKYDPVFFTENQAGVNPHDEISCKESARIIISHVTKGVREADKANLPQFVKDFILTHHGKGITKYFYIKYKNEHPDEDVDIQDFVYPGPNPFTREQAILMMADTVEAASRSLPEYTEDSICDLVNRLIDQQVADGFFKECPITFRDIAQAKLVLIERLKAIYHTRIQYPELKQ